MPNSLARSRRRTMLGGAAIFLTMAAGTALAEEPDPGAVDDAAIASHDDVSPDKGKKNAQLVFSADDGVHGTSLWITDGTPKGTKLVKDVNPGPGRGDINELVKLKNGQVVFSATDIDASDPHGFELWTTDGTPKGTKLLKDVEPGPNGSNIGWLRNAIDGKALFKADTSVNGGELWITNGTPKGTKLVKDIFEGRHVDPWVGDVPNSGTPWQLTPIGGEKIIFRGQSASNDTEPWISDGTAAGTLRLKDINPGSGGSGARDFVHLGDGRTIFSATDGAKGGELWITDGTPAGTKLVKDINPGSGGSNIGGTFFKEISFLKKGKAVFSALLPDTGRELWVTDGTADGTKLIKDIDPGLETWGDAASSDPQNMTPMGDGRVLFSADERAGDFELWITDGTSGGTKLVKDINPGMLGSGPRGFLEIRKGQFLFAATDAARGRELWVTDGTEKGTKLVKDINPGPQGGLDVSVLAFGLLREGLAVFRASDGKRGVELWVTDGTPKGTKLLEDINKGEGASSPSGFTPLRD